MNLDKLRATFTKNRVALGALGAVAVAALAWRARTGTSADATAATDVAQPAGTSATPSYYTATGAYDSTATDIYNAIQPQLEELRDIAAQIPVPGKTTAPAVAPGYYRPTGASSIYRVDDQGRLDWLSGSEWQDLGQPAATVVSKDDDMWKGTLIGQDSPKGTLAALR